MHATHERTLGLMLDKRQSPPAGYVPVSAYVGGSKNLKDLTAFRVTNRHPETGDIRCEDRVRDGPASGGGGGSKGRPLRTELEQTIVREVSNDQACPLCL